MIRYVIAAAGLLAISATAAAQVPPDIAAKVRAAGQKVDASAAPDYAAMFPPGAWQGVKITRGLSYGDDPQQTLDLYVPAGGGDHRPVLLFVHGGGFVRGSRHGDFYPDNITLWAARQGMIGVNIDYRLAPKDPWPAGARDLAAAIAWVRANVPAVGGDPDRIVLWGHSAGANHVADYLAHPELHGPEFAAVKGAILLSPFYAIDPPAEPNHAYYGNDRALQSASTAIEGLRTSGVPLFLGDAEFDPPGMQAFAAKAREDLCNTPKTCPRSVHLKDHNHLTEGMAVGTTDWSLTGPLLDWLAGLGG